MTRLSLASALLVLAGAICGSHPASQASQASQETERAEPVRKAVAWLQQTMNSPDWNQSGGGMANEEAKRDVVTLVTAWLLEMQSDLPGLDAFRTRLREQADRVAAQPRGIAALPFSNWLDGFATLYVLERSWREGKAHPLLDRIARRFVDRQNAEGGWGHGGGTLTNFYPTTLVATTNLALLSLGGAARFNTPVVATSDYKDAVAEGLKLLQDVQAPHGGMPYGGRPYRKGYEAGRTAGMLPALAVLGRTDDPLFQRAADYALRNMAEVPHGHASPALHFALGSLAFATLSDDAWQRYDATVLEKVRRVQQQDGSFRDAAGTSPDSLLDFGNGKRITTAYMTALYAAALSGHRSEIARRFRVPIALALKDRPTAEGKPAVPLWTLKVDPLVAVAPEGDWLAVLHADGRLTCHEAGTGKERSGVTLPLEAQSLAHAQVAMSDGKVLVLVPPLLRQLPAGASLQTIAAQAGQPAGPTRLFCFRAGNNQLLWQIELSGAPNRWHLAEGRVALTNLAGEVTVCSLADGRVLCRQANSGFALNGAALVLPEQRTAVCRESLLTMLAADGTEAWEKTSRAPRGVNPPAFCALAVAGPWLYTGRTDGVVECREAATGRLAWQAELATGVYSIHVDPTAPERLLVLDWSGHAFGLRAGKVLWKTDLSLGKEIGTSSHQPLTARLTAAGLIVAIEGQDHLLCVDVGSGALRSVTRQGKLWGTSKRHLFVGDVGELRGYDLQR